MAVILRLFVVAAALVGVLGAGVAVAHRGHDPAAGATPLGSSVDERIEDGWTVLRYSIASGDALVIRLSGDELASCNVKVHRGPRIATERIRLGIDVDYLVVPAARADATVSEQARDCAEYWINRD